jgi:maleylpyruvate isomerase
MTTPIFERPAARRMPVNQEQEQEYEQGQHRQRLEWLAAGTELFDRELAALSDHALDEPSLLPGWTRRHVIAHVGYNAQALSRLLHWARTGEETPMYADMETRNRQIAEGAELGPLALRELAASSAGELRRAIDTLPEQAWSARVVTAQGRTVPATEIPWMRCREVWVHAVDLAGEASFDRFPAALLDAFIDDITATRQRNAQPPGLRVTPTDRTRQWRVDIDGQRPAVLTGTADFVVAALTGRLRKQAGDAAGAPDVPELGRWI